MFEDLERVLALQYSKEKSSHDNLFDNMMRLVAIRLNGYGFGKEMVSSIDED